MSVKAPAQMMPLCVIAIFMLLPPINSLGGSGDGDLRATHRTKKLLNLFTVVRFRNVPCVGSNNLNGTCYSSAECVQRGGSSSGSCASGYGVCCTFTVGCASTSSENCTYFQSSNPVAGQCCATICPCNDNICQLRLDFETFVITGPSTVTTAVGKALNGILVGSTGGANGVSVSTRNQCLTDTFSVTAPGNNAPPVICGSNTGDHMYLDASPTCNMLCFQLGNTATGAAIATRSWSIKVTQYSCDFNNLAPDGCTQYFFGTTNALVQSYNFDGGEHLAEQDQSICVRRERNQCRICWSPMATTDFALSGTVGKNGLTAASGTGTVGACCGFGSDGARTNGFDCVIIPGASKNTNNANMLPGDEFCGRLGFATEGNNNANQATVCSRSTPFRLRFLSDTYEFATGAIAEASAADIGFQIAFIQTAC